jgi:hypothetical protein
MRMSTRTAPAGDELPSDHRHRASQRPRPGALLGLIVKTCDLDLPLISVQRIDQEEGPL